MNQEIEVKQTTLAERVESFLPAFREAIENHPEIVRSEKEAMDAIARATKMVVSDHETASLLSKEIAAIKRAQDEIAALLKLLKQSCDAIKAVPLGYEKKYNWDSHRRTFQDVLSRYAALQEKLRQQKIREQEAEARKQQEKLDRLNRKAMQEKLEEAAVLEIQGKQAEANEKAAEAEIIEEQAERSVIPVVVTEKEEKIQGYSQRSTLTVEIDDIQKVCQAIANGQLPITCVEFKNGKLVDFAKTMNFQPGSIVYGLKIGQKFINVNK